ncbi:phage-related minor tail protein [Rathayibacter sp. PhB151]|uniref:phage tail tape measure protein n=1 Tax=Rathayibacter sp. PhB151 TaxID=2485189 RepID=UPI001063F58B|nr:phage tail tape measure protein [Rathayibacter sp. PhB151]TDX78726.1 phage-related minor tail protein [Rathayibacter sp. PhB151]
MPLRAAELEVLFTANTTDIARGEKDVKTAGERIEKKPIQAKVDVDTKDALAGMARVEKAANSFDAVFDKLAPSDQQRRDLIRGFLESERASKQSAEQIEKVLTKSYGVAGSAAKQLAAAAKGEFKDIESAGKKLGAQDVTVEVEAETADALAGMDRVEKAAKKLVNQRTVAVIDADISKAEKAVARTQQKLEELQARALGGLDVTAETRRAEAALQKTQRQLAALTSARAQIEVEADVQDAIEGLDQVDANVKRLVSREIAVQVDANVKSAQSAVTRLEAQLAQLAAMEPTTEVRAETYKAEALLEGARKKLQSLEGARAQMEVEVDTASAEQGLDAVADQAGEAGKRGGADAGGNLATGILTALASIPIAGAVIGVGKAGADAILQAFQEGLQQEKSFDRLQGLTGISEKDALRFGRSASESYANGFGESIEQNMDTARLGLQFDLIDPEATNRDAQQVISGLSGIADVLGEDVQPVAVAVTSLLRSGLAKSASEAFDILATGAREGVNRNEDLLDTFTEYPALFQRLGLSGQEALGLINQGLEGGARNSDLAADALKEFQIRATDGSKASAEGFAALGLNAEEMTAKIAAGGDSAKEGLDQVLDGLRAIEDPVARNAAAVALFGTQAEDLGEALFNMDLSTAVDQLNGVEGAAQRMFDTLADNDASKLEQAQRNIEVAADGMKGALAAAFSEPLGELAEFVSENRGPVLQFMLDLANGALDFGDSMIESSASATESLGEFVSGALRDAVIGLRDFLEWLPGDQDLTGLNTLIDDMDGFDEKANITAENLRTNMGGALSEARTKLNEFGEGAVAMGYLNDASLRLAESVDAVGYSLDGTTPLVDAYTVAQDGSVQAGSTLEGQIRASIAALGDEVSAAAATGEAQEALTGRYNTATDALVGQLTQMGLTEGQARSLINTVLQTPSSATTAFSSNAPEQQGKVQSLADRIVTLPDGSVVITADTGTAYGQTQSYLDWVNTRSATIKVNATNPNIGFGLGDGRKDGGPIYGPGGPRDDLVPIWASPGEHMLDAEDVRNAGGHEGVFRLRQMLASGKLKFADGGPVEMRSIPSSTWRVAEGALAAPMLQQDPSMAAIFSALERIGTSGTAGGGGDFVGELVLDSGELVALVRGIIRSVHSADSRRAKALSKRG